MKYYKSTSILGRVKAFMWRVEYQQKGLPHAHILSWTDSDTTDIHEMDKLINARYPQRSSVHNEQEMISDFRALIDQFQIHHHSRRCRKPSGKCKYGYPQPVNAESRIQKCQYLFKRSELDQNIVPHKLALLYLLRRHHCSEIIDSDQCIRYMHKYCSKNSDIHPIRTVIYEGRKIDKKKQLEYCAASRIRSAVEYCAQIYSDRRHHLSPAVGLLAVYLENKKTVLIHPNNDPEERLN
jgi:hypothetical protein